MSLDPVIGKIVALLSTQVAAGDYWGCWGEEKIAEVAVKRWNTYVKRHPKAKRTQDWERVLDLAKGLRLHFDPDNMESDAVWDCLANSLLPILRESNTDD